MPFKGRGLGVSQQILKLAKSSFLEKKENAVGLAFGAFASK
jgi:hypothetical protein